MNQQSLFFKLNILFIISLLATLIAGGSIVVHISKKDQIDMMVKSRLIANEYRTSSTISNELLEEFEFAIIDGKEKLDILTQARKRPMEPFGGGIRLPKQMEFFPYGGHLYLHIMRGGVDILLQDKRTEFDRFALPLLILFLTMALLVVMYILLRRALMPLRQLERDITLYGEGKLGHYTLPLGRDEISQVTNAFYHSATKLRRLSDSRMLFIRNLFHELNTPVTKGKILAELVENEKTKNMLEMIFSRLAQLLKELGRIEQITSENYTLSPTNVRIADLIDEASDLLFLEQPIQTNVKDEIIHADFASMSIVFKNLIDNAYKYGKEPQILHYKNKLYFISKGEGLEGDFKRFLEPFSQTNTNKKEGMGLGLYIVNEVLELHQMRLSYIHEDGKNIFTVEMTR